MRRVFVANEIRGLFELLTETWGRTTRAVVANEIDHQEEETLDTLINLLVRAWATVSGADSRNGCPLAGWLPDVKTGDPPDPTPDP
jgi:hypothetical protein